MSHNSKAFKLNSTNIENICHKLESRLRDVQAEGLLDKELKICMLIGKKYWLLGDIDRATMFCRSALEIAQSIDDTRDTILAHDLLLNLSLEQSMCVSQLLTWIDGRNIFGMISHEYSLFCIQAIFYTHSCELLLVNELNAVRSFLATIDINSCVHIACSVILNFLTTGKIDKRDQDNLQDYATKFGCEKCDLITHVRIFHLLGDLCISQGLDSIASLFFELALSLSYHPDFTEHIYVSCLIKLAKLYALERQFDLAWTTIYVAKDIISRSQSPLISILKALTKNLEGLVNGTHSFNSILSLGAVRKAVKFIQNFDNYSINLVMFCRNESCLKSLIGVSRSNSPEFVTQITKLAWLESLGGNTVDSAEYLSLSESSNEDPVSKVYIEGVRALIAGKILEYHKFCDDFRSLMKARCLEKSHDHSFSYFLTRGASKSLLKLVDGYKMDTKGVKISKGLVMETAYKKRIDDSFCDQRPTKRSQKITFVIDVSDNQFEYTVDLSTAEVSTVGWLKGQVTKNIFDGVFVLCEVGEVIDDNQCRYNNHDMLIQIYHKNKGEHKIKLSAQINPLSINIDGLASACDISVVEKEWLRHSLKIDDSKVIFGQCDDELTKKLLPKLLNALKLFSYEWSVDIRSITVNQKLPEIKFKNSNVQGNWVDIEDGNSYSKLNISNCSINDRTLSALSEKLHCEIKRLEAADCSLSMDIIAKKLDYLEYVDLSYNFINDVYKLFKSLSDNCPILSTLILDGMEYSENADNYLEPCPVHNLSHLSMGFCPSGLFPCLVLESLTSSNFKGSIDIRYSRIVGFEDRLTRALMKTSFSQLDTTGVESEKTIIVKTSFI